MQINIPMPSGVDFRTTAVAANGALAIGDRVQIRNPSSGFGSVANAGTAGSDFGVSSSVGVVTSVAAVSLRDRSHVTGSVTSGGTVTQSSGVRVDGGVIANAPFGAPDIASWQIQVPPSSQSVILTRSQALDLLPGAYSQVTVYGGASLRLGAGTYFIDQLDLESQAGVTLDDSAGPIAIYVQSALIYRGNVTGGTGDRLLLAYLGSQAIALETSFHGTLVAPAASVRLGVGGTPHAGAVFARDIQVDPGVSFTAVPFASWDSVILGVAPTLNCVAQLDSNTFAAVFGYRNTASATVTLGAGPRNFLSSTTDAGQPILFVPGEVPIATVQTFPAGSQLSWTIGQQSVVASAASNACPAALGAAVSTLFVETPDTRALRQSFVSMLANPRFATLLHAIKNSAGPQLTPFVASLFDSLDLVIANADLLADPATLTATQLARLPDFRAALLSNPAILALRSAGDAKRADASALQCVVLNELNTDQPSKAFLPIQAGSVAEDVLALATSTAFVRARTAFAGVAGGDESAAILGAPGLALAGLLSATELDAIQLAGPIPTGFLKSLGKIAGVVVGAALGAVAGAAGGPAGIVVGGILGGLAGAAATGLIQGDGACRPCRDSGECGGETCNAGCCETDDFLGISINFLTGSGCANGAASCHADSECGGGGAECVQGCCRPLSLLISLCPGEGCTTEADCRSGESCQGGCCVGRCGIGGTPCNVISVSAGACGIAPASCLARDFCDDQGCCEEPAPR
ncbi:MAG TPA: hypothetical protein VHW23_20160 [Kofleriaceae bacterium]|nr:hypothetical protein [Kofleriaceae bacterium]